MVHPGPVLEMLPNVDQTRLVTRGLPFTKEEMAAGFAAQYPGVDTVGLEDLASMIQRLAFRLTLFLWDSATGEMLFELKHPEQQIHGYWWNHDGTRLLTIAGGDVVSPLVELFAQALLAGAEGGDMPEFSMEEFQGVSSVRIWNINTRAVEFEVTQPETFSQAIWSPDETQILTTTLSGRVMVWNIATGQPDFEIPLEGELSDVQWNPAGSAIWGLERRPLNCLPPSEACEEVVWRVWDARNGQPIVEKSLESSSLALKGWNGDKTLVVFALVEPPGFTAVEGIIMDASGAVRARLPHDSGIIQVVWNVSGTRLLTLSLDGILRLWEIPADWQN